MAVADAALPSPPPPPARIVVAVPPSARFAPAPMLALGRLLDFALEALPYLCFSVAWVMSAALAAKVVARRAWGEGSTPFLLLQAFAHGAFKVLACIFLVLLALAVLLLCGLWVAYVIAAVSGFGSEFKQLRSEGVRRIWQGATVPILLMVVSDPNRYKISEDKTSFCRHASFYYK